MKVVQVLYSGLGGHANVAFSIEKAALSNSTWFGLVIFFGIEQLLPDYRRRCSDLGVPLQYIQAREGTPWQSWWALFRALIRARPDAIVLHSVKTILPCWLYARLYSVPIVAVEHQSNSLKTSAERRTSKLLMRLADAVVVLTPAYRDGLRNLVGKAWREDKVHVIPNGIDTNCISPQRRLGSILGKRPRVLGMASRFTGIKRHDVLLAALVCLRDRGHGSDWHLSLAGDGETLDSLRQWAAEHELDEMIEFTGCLDETHLLSWYHNLDIYVQASDGETLSTSVLQAMSLGLPIVVSPVPGLEDLISAGGCGLVAKGQTPEAFSDAFQSLVDDSALSNDIACRARELAVNEYSQETMFKRYHQLLNSCLK